MTNAPAETPKYNFVIHQGATKTFSLELAENDGTPINLTSYTCALSIKDSAGGSSYLDLTSSPAAGVVITASAGLIEFVITAAQTAAFTFHKAEYDVKLSDGSTPAKVTYLLMGEIQLIPRITA